MHIRADFLVRLNGREVERQRILAGAAMSLDREPVDALGSSGKYFTLPRIGGPLVRQVNIGQGMDVSATTSITLAGASCGAPT